MRISSAVVLAALPVVFATPLHLGERGSCPKTNLIASVLHASSSASSWCSGLLSVSTKTSTITVTRTVVSTTTSVATTGTSTSVASVLTVFASTTTVDSTSTSTVYSTETDTAGTTSVLLGTETLTLLQGTTTISTTCGNQNGKRAAKCSTPAALKPYSPSCLSSACSCLSLTTPTVTVTSSAGLATITVTSTSNVYASTAITSATTATATETSTTTVTTTQTTATSVEAVSSYYATSTVIVPAATQIVYTLGITATDSSLIPNSPLGVDAEGDLIANVNGTGVDFTLDPSTGWLTVSSGPNAGGVLYTLSSTGSSFVEVSGPDFVAGSQSVPLVCAASCEGPLVCAAAHLVYLQVCTVTLCQGCDPTYVISMDQVNQVQLQTCSTVSLMPVAPP